MILAYIVTVVIIIFLAAWLYMIKPAGKKHPLRDKMSRYIYAHRGLHDLSQLAPENSIAAFRRAMTQNYGIELDLHLSADGSPIVMHDRSLRRTVGEDIDITSISDADIKNYQLEGTSERIPFFREVLAEVAGRVPLLIELKVDNNAPLLCEAVIKDLQGYTGVYAIQSFDPRALRYLRKKHPHIMRGQLAGFLRKNGDTLHLVLDFGLRNLLTNFLTKPHFISYRVQDTDKLSVSMCRKLYKPLEFNWTCRRKKHHVTAHKNGAIPIFEDYIPSKKSTS